MMTARQVLPGSARHAEEGYHIRASVEVLLLDMRSSPKKSGNPQTLDANLARPGLCYFEALWTSISDNRHIELYSAENLK